MGASALLTARTIASGETLDTEAEKLRDGLVNHALSYLITGDGSVSIEVLISVDGRNFIKSGRVVKGATKTSGPNGDGQGYVALMLLPGEFIKFRVVVASAEVVLSLWFVQK